MQPQAGATRQKACAPGCEQGAAMKPVAAGVELASLSHARVSISAQSVTSERASSFSLEASLTYTRIAMNTAPPREVASAPVAPVVDEAAAQAPVMIAPGSAEPVAADDAVLATAPQASFSFYEHVLFNATSSYFSVRSGNDSLPKNMMMAAPATAVPARIDASDSSPAQRVARLSAADYADSFTKMRMRSSEQTTETALSLKLSTREGDTVELDFRQVEMLSRMRLKGVAENGDRVRANQNDSSLERAVQMNVKGDLSAAEMAAIDSLIDEVIGVANKFFSGDVGAAWDRLMSMEFSSDELAEFSLRMSVAHTKQVSSAYQGDDGMSRFASRDKQSLDVLEFLAGQQRSLIESAQKHFDDASAVSLVRELLPRLLPDAPAPAEQTEATQEPVLA